MPSPNLGKLYGAAFGFNTDRRVKPVHFATGFFLAVTGRNYKQQDLNLTVALSARKEPEGKYALAALREHLIEAGKISRLIESRELHLLRSHLHAVADNDDAVYPMFGAKAGFGSDYSSSSGQLVSRTKDNDGFLGQFVKSVLVNSADGVAILRAAETWLKSQCATTDELLAPLLDPESEEMDLGLVSATKLGELAATRLKNISNLLVLETTAIRRLCDNCARLPVESRLRNLVIGLGCWVASYFRRFKFNTQIPPLPLLVDMTNGVSSRMRDQSRWSYSRFREIVVDSFAALSETSAFEDCQEEWEYVKSELQGRPKVEEFFRELLIRNGLAQPRGGRVNAKHFELQPDTFAVLALSLIDNKEGFVPLPEFFERMFTTWGLCFGGRSTDAEALTSHGYFGLDEKSDLSANVEATTDLLIDLGFAHKYSDGLVLCEIGNSYKAP